MVDEIDLVAADHRFSAVQSRHAIRSAISMAAKAHDGLVHISDVRPLLPDWVTPHQVGAVFTALVRSGVLVWTGEYRPSGNAAQRNAQRPAKVYHLKGDAS